MTPNLSPMNVGHAAGMRMQGMPQPPGGYPRSMNNAPQYLQVGSLFNFSLLNRESFYWAISSLKLFFFLWRPEVCYFVRVNTVNTKFGFKLK